MNVVGAEFQRENWQQEERSESKEGKGMKDCAEMKLGIVSFPFRRSEFAAQFNEEGKNEAQIKKRINYVFCLICRLITLSMRISLIRCRESNAANFSHSSFQFSFLFIHSYAALNLISPSSN